MSSSFSFVRYITKKHKKMIKNAFDSYFKENPFCDAETGEEFETFCNSFEPQFPKFDSFDTPFRNFCIAYNVESAFVDKTDEEELVYSHYSWYTLVCSCDDYDGFSNFKIKSIMPYEKKSLTGSLFSDSLVPFIGKDKYELAADFFVNKYLDDRIIGYDNNMLISIASKMGLTIKKTRIAKDKSVFGRIYFYDTSDEFYDPFHDCVIIKNIPANTIIVDNRIVNDRTVGTLNNTIFHEFVHYVFHRYAVELRRAYGCGSDIECKVSYVDDKSDYSIMESQAKAIAPRIIMRKEKFKSIANYTLETTSKFVQSEFEKIFPNTDIKMDPIYSMSMVIDRLADKFKVSRFSVRLRMIDLGFEEAKGAMIYLDNHYVESHKSSSNYSLKDYQSFAISSKNFYELYENNEDFKRFFISGHFVFANNFCIIDDEKYIVQFASGESILTPYALSHMEECCIIFESDFDEYHGSKINAQYLYLNNNKYFGEIPLKFEINNQVKIDLIPFEEEEHLLEIISKNNFCDAFFEVTEFQRKKLGIKVESFAKDLGLDIRTLSHYRHGEIPKVEILLAISFYLKLTGPIIDELMYKSGMHLVTRDNNSHRIYQRIITTRPGYEYSFICAEIEKLGGDPLL